MQNEFYKDYPDIISTSQLCEMLQISETTALKLIKSGKIKSKRIGRAHKVIKSSVLEYLLSGNVA